MAFRSTVSVSLDALAVLQPYAMGQRALLVTRQEPSRMGRNLLSTI